MALTLTQGGQMSCSYSVSCGLEAVARMQDDATGEERTAYTHCSHLILQAGVVLQIPRLSICSITPECAAWMCYEPSAFPFFPSFFPPFLFQVILRCLSPLTESELQVRPGSSEDPLFDRALLILITGKEKIQIIGTKHF